MQNLSLVLRLVGQHWSLFS